VLQLIGADAFEAIGVCPIECIGVAAPRLCGPVSPLSVVVKVSGKAWQLRCCHSRCHPCACRTVDSLPGSRVGRGVSAAPDHNSAVAFGSGPPVRRNDS
jgi:hypothetical protein